jgi:hypothetical protein
MLSVPQLRSRTHRSTCTYPCQGCHCLRLLRAAQVDAARRHSTTCHAMYTPPHDPYSPWTCLTKDLLHNVADVATQHAHTITHPPILVPCISAVFCRCIMCLLLHGRSHLTASAPGQSIARLELVRTTLMHSFLSTLCAMCIPSHSNQTFSRPRVARGAPGLCSFPQVSQ